MALIIIIALAGLIAAAVLPLLARAAPRAAGWLAALLLASLAVVIALRLPTAGGEVASWSRQWAGGIGLTFSLRMDGLSGLFALIITGIGAIVFVYATGYMSGHRRFGQFLGLLMLFSVSMLGIVLADNLLLLYICWELTTISSWLLIGFEHDREEARRSAWQALIVTAGGGLAMLAAFVLIGQMLGTYELSAILSRGGAVRESALHVPILLLIVIGAAAKSALVPLHFWLPNAMAAPTPVSAYLHSAAMVKAGIYLLARLSPALSDSAVWTLTVATLGVLTALVGAWLALMQTDVKRMLAYTTISALGTMTLMLGIGGERAVRAAMAFLLAHSLYKAAMFMVAGCLDHGAGTRDLSGLGGLRRKMPWTAAAAGVAMLSMVALPPTLGYVSEEAVLGAIHHGEGPVSRVLLIAQVLAMALYSGAGLIVGLRPFVGALRTDGARGEAPSDPGAGQLGPPLLLGMIGVALFFVPGRLDALLISPATGPVAGHAPESRLELWHGVTVPFLLGWAVLIGGLIIMLVWTPLREGAVPLKALARAGPDRIYRGLERAVQRLAALVDRRLQHGYLPVYLLIVALTVLAISVPPLLNAGAALPVVATPVRHYDAVLAAVIVLAAAGAIWCRSRVAVISCMGVTGYSVALLFAEFGGPDLAIAQVLVETLLVVLIVLLLPALPSFEKLERPVARVRDGLLCIGVGVMVASLLLLATAGEQASQVSEYYREHSEARGGGRNIVNTILVNFRAADTLGESSVLLAAGIASAALMRAGRRGSQQRAQFGRMEGTRLESLVLTVAGRVLMPLLMVFALYLLLIGHSAPGGGFAAALVLAAALAIHVFGNPRAAERELLRLAPSLLLGAGLLIMVVSGVIGLLLGDPLLTAQWLPWKLPVMGGLHPGTTLLFDAGICVASAGAIFVMLRSLEERGPWKF